MRSLLLIAVVARWCAAQPAAEFDGTWVFKSEGQAIFKLTLTTERGVLGGTLTRPKELVIDQDGDVTDIGPEQETRRVSDASRKNERLEMTIGEDPFVMTLESHGRASLALPGMHPWKLERVSDGTSVTLASRLPTANYPKEIQELREELGAMEKADQEARLAFDEKAMKVADERNRVAVLRIFERYGWVTRTLAGKDASHNFWLLVQHQTPEIQQRMLPALEKAAKSGDASMSDYAYLYDRVQMGLGKPQHWGSQMECKNGKPSLYVVDDPAGLDARRSELFMLPIGEYLQVDYLLKFCAGK